MKSSRDPALAIALAVFSLLSARADCASICPPTVANHTFPIERALETHTQAQSIRPHSANVPFYAAGLVAATNSRYLRQYQQVSVFLRAHVEQLISTPQHILNSKLPLADTTGNLAQLQGVLKLAGSNPAVIIAFAPNFVLVLVIGALLGMSARCCRQIKKSRTKLPAPAAVSDAKPSAAAHRTSEARFRALIENSTNPVVLFDEEGKILYCNRVSERILGLPPEELVGRSGFDCIHTEDRVAVQTTLRQCIENPRGLATVRARVLHRDGSVHLLEGVFENLLHDADIRAVVNNYRDITDAAAAEVAWRESEERFAKAFRSGPLAMSISTQAEGRYLDVNEAFLQMLGYERSNVIGRTAIELNIWAEREERVRMIRELSESGVAKGLHARFRTQSGHIREVSVSAELVELDGASCVLAITQDVTEARRLEDHLRQVQKMEALGRLAGGVAHDFNNILGVIMGYSEISMDRLDSAHHLFKNLAEIKRGAERAASLTRQLLAFTRQQVLYPRVLDLNTVVSDLNLMLQRMIGEDVSLSCKPATSLGWVKLDLGQIEQILMNLVVNARDAMPSGGKITIETSNVEIEDGDLGAYFSVRPGRYVLLSVSDTGCGMDQETMASIFEPFFTTKGPGLGTGLGLSTVYGIVKQSDGYIVVFSEPDKGTTFKLYFPRRDEENAEPLSDDVFHAEAARRSETILVVEDDESLRKLTVRFLEGAGYRVLQAGNAQGALQLMEGFLESVDLLLTDMIMPVMSGIELSGRLRAAQPDLRVLLMSGYAGEYTARYKATEEETPLLEKPFTRRQLLAKISAVLHG